MNSIRLSFLALGAVVGALLAPAGCGLSSDTTIVSDGGPPCSTDEGCAVKGNPCIVPVCGAMGTCENHALAGDPPDDKAGDCLKPVCNGEVETHVADKTDPEDDGNPCTIDTCEPDGTTSHKPAGDNTMCMFHGNTGKCEKGNCSVPCSDNKPCQTDSKCTEVFCDPDTNLCGFTLLDGVPVPNEPNVVGDCKDVLCEKGEKQTLTDTMDIPNRKGVCYTPSCDGPTPTQTPKAENTKCSNGSGGIVCDDSGNCVACNMPSQCPQSPMPCILATCKSNKCGFENAPANMTEPGIQQTDGDCSKVVCDGSGGTKTIYDSTDPQDDGNDCTTDTCVSKNMTTHPAHGGMCGANNAFMCFSGQCGCQTNADCGAPNPYANAQCVNQVCQCTPSTCGSLGLSCGNSVDGCGNALHCNNGVKDGAEGGIDCGGSSGCGPCQQGTQCSTGSDCGTGNCADGVCCDTGCGGCQACTTALKGGGADGTCGDVPSPNDPHGTCNDGGASNCGNDGACNGSGACENYASGTQCSVGCPSGNQLVTKQCAGGSCSSSSSTTCGGNFVCNTGSNSCYMSCTTSAQCVSGFYCTPGGTCASQVAKGQPCPNGTPECSSGNTCVDGVCCGTSSCGTCQTCNGSSAGNCTGLNGVSDPPGCMAPSTCVAGTCTAACMDATCPVCQVCIGGACGNDSEGSQEPLKCDDGDVGNCGGGHNCACDGSGMCKRKGGESCCTGGDCASGNCTGSPNCPSQHGSCAN